MPTRDSPSIAARLSACGLPYHLRYHTVHREGLGAGLREAAGRARVLDERRVGVSPGRGNRCVYHVYGSGSRGAFKIGPMGRIRPYINPGHIGCDQRGKGVKLTVMRRAIK